MILPVGNLCTGIRWAIALVLYRHCATMFSVCGITYAILILTTGNSLSTLHRAYVITRLILGIMQLPIHCILNTMRYKCCVCPAIVAVVRPRFDNWVKINCTVGILTLVLFMIISHGVNFGHNNKIDTFDMTSYVFLVYTIVYRCIAGWKYVRETSSFFDDVPNQSSHPEAV